MIELNSNKNVNEWERSDIYLIKGRKINSKTISNDINYKFNTI